MESKEAVRKIMKEKLSQLNEKELKRIKAAIQRIKKKKSLGRKS